MTIISLVVAMDKNRLIGADNRIPWRLPDDMKYFREITMGKPVLMGRKTYESIPVRFRPLEGRTNIVLTTQLEYVAPGCIVVHSLNAALDAVGDEQELMIIGGAIIYEQFLPAAHRLFLTLVDGEFDGDVYFPELDKGEWLEVSRESHSPDEQHAFPFAFVVLERQKEK